MAIKKMIKHTHTSFIGFFAFALILQTPPANAQSNDSDEGLENAQPDAQTSGSGNENTGIFQLNQSAADLTQQDNIFAASVVTNDGAALSDATSTQRASNNSPSTNANTSALLADVANASTGIVAINQSSATGSAQANIASIALTKGTGGLAAASATGSAVIGQSNPGVFDGGLATSTIANIGNDSSGIYAINQVSGNGGTQENIIAIAAATNGVALADVTGSGLNGSDNDNDSLGQNGQFPANAGAVSLTDSFNNMSGLVQLNQASGGNNLQSNLIAIAFGNYADTHAISDAGLGTVHPTTSSSDNDGGDGNQGSILLAGSFDGFTGVAQVSQVSGHQNQVANTMTVTMTHIPGGG